MSLSFNRSSLSHTLSSSHFICLRYDDILYSTHANGTLFFCFCIPYFDRGREQCVVHVLSLVSTRNTHNRQSFGIRSCVAVIQMKCIEYKWHHHITHFVMIRVLWLELCSTNENEMERDTKTTAATTATVIAKRLNFVVQHRNVGDNSYTGATK